MYRNAEVQGNPTRARRQGSKLPDPDFRLHPGLNRRPEPRPPADALRKAGCDEVFEDRISGKTTSRPALDRLLPQLRRGDTLAVWELDRLGRCVLHLVALLE